MASESLTFKVSVFQPAVHEAAKSRSSHLKERAAPKPKKHEELGIEIQKMWDHPRCKFCRMWDPGKKSGEERPDILHQQNCRARTLGPKPTLKIQCFDAYGRPITGKFEENERTGSFVGEAPDSSVLIPVRRVLQLPERDEDGNPVVDPETGKTTTNPICTYDLKECRVLSWIWDGSQWVEWYRFQPPKDRTNQPEPDPMPEYRGSWFAHEASKGQVPAVEPPPPSIDPNDLPF